MVSSVLRTGALGILPVLLLVACTREQQAVIEEVMETKEATSSTATSSQKTGMATDDAGLAEDPLVLGVYHDYTRSGLPESVLRNGAVKVLFFHAAWCPVCRRVDEYLRTEALNGTFKGEALRSVYRVNFDEESKLRARYGVTYQHTFVRVDGEGAELAKIEHPTNEELYEFIAQ